MTGSADRKARALFPRRLDLARGVTDMNHGAGGRAMAQLVQEIFAVHFDNPLLNQGDDGAVFTPPPGRLAITTDSFVVSPLFFPGGDIGSLAAHGVINDLATAGAAPLHLTAAFIIEEGFALADLNRIAQSMAAAARAAGCAVVAGDTKVVERGKGDGVFISATGVGVIPPGVAPSGDRARPGDAVLINGFIGDHGVAVMAARDGLEFETPLLSDSAALHDLIATVVAAVPDVHVLRDPTRGGLAATLNEIAWQSGVGFRLRETAVPIRPQVAAVCELLGLDPLNVANEGKMIVICAAEDADKALAALRAHPLGAAAAIIGDAIDDPNRFVQLETAFGGRRIVDWLTGEQLPRIC